MVIAIIGGGAAGFFAALSAKKHFPSHQVIIFEKSAKVLSKVKISGGGRCNVTHDCPDNRLLNLSLLRLNMVYQAFKYEKYFVHIRFSSS